MAAVPKNPSIFSISAYTGWRRMAAYLTILVIILTIFLIVTLITSLYGIDHGNVSLQKDTVIWETDCATTSWANLWIHFAINIIATGILGSSNFFMQVLVAPTRQEVDRAHACGQWVEIGVHSVRNFRFLPRHKIFLWLLFSLSSVPLHLVFNGCILEYKASNGFKVLLVADGFLDKAPWRLPPTTMWSQDPIFGNFEQSETTISDIYRDITENAYNWESIDFEECLSRYDDPSKIMHDHRHLIMVIRSLNGTSTIGWTREQIMNKDSVFNDEDSVNSLWCHDEFLHIDSTARMNESWWKERQKKTGRTREPWYMSRVTAGGYCSDSPFTDGVVNLGDENSDTAFRPIKLKVDHCLSEKHSAPCQLSIANPLLLIVCIMCSLKCLLCVFTLTTLGIWREEDPLITSGDAIASFITKPGDDTKDMCTLGSEDRIQEDTHQPRGSHSAYANLKGTWHWTPILKRTAGDGVQRTIWVLSNLLIGSSLLFAGIMFVRAVQGQSIQGSRFEHDAANAAIENEMLNDVSFIGLTVLANVPQLILSVCYMALNGLITRMLVEFEWAYYSTAYRSLRVTEPTGQQRSTYRLQLPYRWSVPVIMLSALLHWIYSNCIYVSYYNYYDPDAPYHVVGTSYGLQYSTRAILAALFLSLTATIAPIILSMFPLPGNIVLGGSNSMVISAACHSIPTASAIMAPHASEVTIERMTVVDGDTDIESLLTADDSFNTDTSDITGDDKLREMATKKLKWGQVSDGSDSDGVGHLAFGVEEQEVMEPIAGNLYR